MIREERLEQCLILAIEVGEQWRDDWPDFDANELLNQMEDLRSVADGEVTPDEYRDDWGLR